MPNFVPVKMLIRQPDGTMIYNPARRLWGVDYQDFEDKKVLCDDAPERAEALLPYQKGRNSYYRATIFLCGKRWFIGRFDTAQKAAQAYDSALFHLWGFVKNPKPRFNYYAPDTVEEPELMECVKTLRRKLFFEIPDAQSLNSNFLLSEWWDKYYQAQLKKKYVGVTSISIPISGKWAETIFVARINLPWLGKIRLGNFHYADAAAKEYDAALFHLWGVMKRPREKFNFYKLGEADPLCSKLLEEKKQQVLVSYVERGMGNPKTLGLNFRQLNELTQTSK